VSSSVYPFLKLLGLSGLAALLLVLGGCGVTLDPRVPTPIRPPSLARASSSSLFFKVCFMILFSALGLLFCVARVLYYVLKCRLFSFACFPDAAWLSLATWASSSATVAADVVAADCAARYWSFVYSRVRLGHLCIFDSTLLFCVGPPLRLSGVQ
jgi:hypothetical protein